MYLNFYRIKIERFDGGKKYSNWSISTCFDEKWKFGKEHKEVCDSLWEAVKKELGLAKLISVYF